ncbi:hypothetical protein FHR72_000741 [Mycolicibacterium iranicum]|uniref:Integral membrane protein n=1 Tax=Mycolicibacterium iranicum TaxID=912594 RepID=A0A839Q2X9_MYCIR|nr:hypothetical protein [Mycolicibacterium iranicum]MBB2989284.1 hypothetical protein [Mycolicibacterium iranicum]
MAGGKTVFELRVHGVSGTPPEAMLHCPSEFLKLQKGDRDAAFYRRSDWIDDAAGAAREGAWRSRMEAYSWGGLTSRRASRALWVLLLPISLINLAHWMLPPTTHRRAGLVVVAVLRLLALSFTVTLLLAMAVSVLDVAVWQCGSVPFCSSGWGPLAFLSECCSGVRLALGALPLVVVILVLWLRGREESSPVGRGDLPPDPVVAPDAESPLADENFWNRDPSVPRMRACHVITWTSALAALLLAVALHYTRTGLHGTVNGVLFGLNLAILAVAVAATGWNRATGRGGAPAPRAVHRTLMVLRWVALASLGATLIWVAFWAGIPDRAPATHLPALREAVYVLLGVQGVLLAGAFAAVALAMRGAPHPDCGKDYRPTLRGYTGPFVALLGWLLGGALSVGVGLWTAQILGTLTFSSADARRELTARSLVLADATRGFEDRLDAAGAAAPLMVPAPYLWTAAAMVVTVAVAVVWAVVVWRRAVRRSGTDRSGDPDVERTAPDDVWEAIGAARALAALTDSGPGMIAGVAVTGSVLFGATALLSTFFPLVVPPPGPAMAVVLGTPVVLVVALLLLAVQGFRNRQARRAVAILWDVVTFWPRSTHPLTLPSYGGRTVLDLRYRLAELTTNDSDGTAATRVVLVAHSQGTIIAAAALMQCTKPEERYPLLTFGSPLRRLYARNFPAYFGYPAMSALRRRLCRPHPRWINLWAHTDPIGGWVFDPSWVYFLDDAKTRTMADALTGADCRILDLPQETTGPCAMRAGAAMCGHGGFWDRDDYSLAVAALQELVVPKDEGAITSATAPPVAQAM